MKRNLKTDVTATKGMKKKVVVTSVIVLMIASLLGGTYAWMDYSQHKTNNMAHKEPKYEAVLVEKFRERSDWRLSDDKVTKRISVKNTGDPVRGFEETYVRLQLKEYMDVYPMECEQTMSRYMIDTKGDFIVYPMQAQAQADYPDAPGIDYLTNAVNGVSGFYVQTKEGDDNGQYGKHLVTKYELSDTANKITPGVTWADNDAKKDNKHDVVAQGSPSNRNGECDYLKYIWHGNYASPAVNPTMEYIRWYLGDDVITLTEWMTSFGDNNGKAVNKWIIDDRAGSVGDAWVYWGQALLPGEKTSDFMRAIELIKQPGGDFRYALHAEMEAISLEELYKASPEWPGMPEDIMEAYKKNSPKVSLSVNGDPCQERYTIEVGGTLDMAGSVAPATADQRVIYKLKGNQQAAVLTPTSKSTAVLSGTQSGKVTVLAQFAASKKVIKIKVTVIDKTSLLQLITQAQSLTESDWTPASWYDLTVALDMATTVAASSTVQAEIEAAADDLYNAINGLISGDVIIPEDFD